MNSRPREFRRIVWEALTEALPFNIPVTALLADDLTRALKKRLKERFDSKEPVFFVGHKELVLKQSRDDRRKERKA